MPRRKNTPFNVTLLGLLLCITLFAASPQMHGGFLMSNFANKLACHFFHANLFHWFCNAMALWLMRPSPKDIAYAFVLAALAMFFTMTPTIGFSAVIYAYIGMNIIRWKVSLIDWGTFLVANLITLFIPGVAFGVHLAAFMLGISVYIIHYQINRILLAVEGK